MKFYYLDTKFTSGRYKGQTLEEVFEKDPEYIENALLEDDNFLITEEVLDELQGVNPNFSFSDEAIGRRDGKEKQFDANNDDGDDEFADEFDDRYIDDDDFAFDEEGFEIEDIDEEDLDDLDDLYEEDEYEEEYDDFEDFGGGDSSWDNY
jgi:hypothetical protein